MTSHPSESTTSNEHWCSHSHLNWDGWGGGQAIGLKLTQWRWDTGDQDQKDMVEVGHKQSGSKRCGGGRRRAIGLELMWWKWDMSSQAQIDMVVVGHEQLCLNWRGGDGRQVVGLKTTWWRQETSGCTWIDTVGVEHKWSGLNWHSGDGTQAVVLRLTWWGWEMSGQARNDVVEAGDKWLCSNGHSWVGGKTAGLKRAWWMWVTSGYTRMDTVGSEMDDWAWKGLVEGRTWVVALRLTRLGGRQAAGLERAWWMLETSSCAQMNTVGLEKSDRAWEGMVEVEHKQSCLNWHGWVEGKQPGLKGSGGSGRQVVVLEWTWLGWRWATSSLSSLSRGRVQGWWHRHIIIVIERMRARVALLSGRGQGWGWWQGHIIIIIEGEGEGEGMLLSGWGWGWGWWQGAEGMSSLLSREWGWVHIIEERVPWLIINGQKATIEKVPQVDHGLWVWVHGFMGWLVPTHIHTHGYPYP